MAAPPLSYQASDASSSRPVLSSSLPPEVATCVKNARFVRSLGASSAWLPCSTLTDPSQLHLATASPAATPNVSLMNYTYLSSTPYTPHPTIIMTTNLHSRKTHNLVSNPRVSLLVHDWVSHRPPTRSHDPARSGSPPPQATRSSLASLLLQMNTSAMSRISATINGEARVVEVGSEEEKWCRDEHLANNSFEGGEEILGTSPQESAGGAGPGGYLEGEEVRVVVVRIRDGRISDWKGGVTDWVIAEPGEEADVPLVNGVTA